MKSGTIRFAGHDLSLYGSPTFSLTRTADPAPPASPTRWRVAITVSIAIQAHMPATAWARARKLASILDAAMEAPLEVLDENTIASTWRATPASHNLSQAIQRGQGTVEITFNATEAISSSGPNSASIPATLTPTTGQPIPLLRVNSWQEATTIQRADERLAHRELCLTSILFSATTLLTDPTLPTTERAAACLEEVQRIRSLNSKDATLACAGFSGLVQVESARATPAPGWESVETEVQCRHVALPGADSAEANFTSTTEENPATGEIRTSITGRIEAVDRTDATAKAANLFAALKPPGARVALHRIADAWLDGEDGTADAAAWTGLDFSFDFLSNTPEAAYTLNIQSREAADGAHLTYSGTVRAATIAAAQAAIASIAYAKHPVEVRRDETLELTHPTTGALEVHFVQATFSAEYLVASTIIRGNAQGSTIKSAFSDWRHTLSGSITAPTLAAAEAAARALIPAGKETILLANEEKSSTQFQGSGPQSASQFHTLEFTYAWAIPHSTVQIAWTDATAPDYTRMSAERTISGSAWAANRAAAEAAVAALITALSLTNPTRATFTHPHEQFGDVSANARWQHYQFTFSFDVPISGEIAHDIIESSWSIARTGMVNHIPITEIPLATPVQQSTYGYNMGRITLSGFCRARLAATAIAWGQSKNSLISSIFTTVPAPAPDPPDERITAANLPFNGSIAATYQFDFTYAYRVSHSLTGLMPTGIIPPAP